MDNNTKKYFENVEKKYYLEDITGAKVKIDVDKIKSRKSISKKFNEFLDKSKNKIFTAKLDIENHYIKMYVLEEDENNIKWLFHVEDLILVKE